MAAPSMVIKIAGDLSALQAAMEKGEGYVKAVATSVNRLSHSFEGPRIVADANLMIAAVQQLGSQVKLTAKDNERINASMKKAIEVLGQDAPKAMVDLEQATRKAEKATEDVGQAATKASTSFGSMFGAFVAGQLTLAALGRAWRTVTDFMSSSIQAYAEEEAAVKKLDTALKAQGLSVQTISPLYREMASEFQRTTKYGDELTIEMQALLTQIGGVMPAQMKGATQAAMDLASGLGIDLRAATMLVGKAFAGETGSLTRYGIVIDEAKLKAGGATAVLEAIQSKFGGQAQAEAETYAGKIQQLSNAWGDFKEQIGKAVVEDPLVQMMLRKMTEASQQATAATNEGTRGWYDYAAAIDASGTLKTLGMIKDRMDATAEALNEIASIHAKTANLPSPFEQWASSRALPTMTEAMREVQAQFRAQITAADEAKKAQEAYGKAVASVRDQLSGAGLQGDLRKLTDAWRGLTPEERSNIDVLARLIEQYGTLRTKLGPGALPADLEAVYQANKRLTTSTETVVAIMNRYGLSVIPVATGATGALARALADAHAGIILATQDFSTLSGTIPALTAEVTGNMEAFADAQPVIKTWGETFTDVLAGIPQLVANAFTGGGGIGGALKGIVSSFGSAGIGKLFSSLAEGTTGVLGAILPGLGAAIGSLIGPLVQKISELFSKPVWKDITARVGNEWGVSISENLAKSIEEQTAKLFGGSRQAAELFNLDKIIGEAGGVDANLASIDKWSRALRDVFSMIETGQMSVAQGSEAVTKTFPLLAAAWQESGETASEQFIELIALNARFGTESKAITDFIGGQWTRLAEMAAQSGSLMSQQFLDLIPLASHFGEEAEAAMEAFKTGQIERAAQGINALITGWADNLLTANDGLTDAQVNLDEINAKMAEYAGKELGVTDQANLDKLMQRLVEAQAEVHKLGSAFDIAATTGQEGFDRMGRLALAAVGSLGGTLYENLMTMKPAFDKLATAGEEFGYTASAGFAEMARMAETVQLNPNLFAQMEGVQQAMVGWHNSGLMNQQLFADLTASIGDTGRQLELQGRGGQQALQLLAGPLQTAWELQTDFGYVTDEATAKMIDQAVEAGVVGEAHRSAQDIAARAMQTVVDLLGRIAVALGAELPESMATASSAASTEAGSMTASFAGTEAAAKANALNTQAEWASKLGALSADAQIKTGQVSGAFGTAETAIKGSVGAVRDAWLAKFHDMQRGADDLTRQAGSSVASNLNAGLGAVDWDGFVSAGEDAMSRVQRAAETAAWGSSPGGVREIGTQATLALSDVHQLAVGLERSALRFEHLALSNRLSDTAVRHVTAPVSPGSATYSTGPITIQIVQRPGENAQQLAERVAETLPRVWQRNYKQSRSEAQAALGVEA